MRSSSSLSLSRFGSGSSATSTSRGRFKLCSPAVVTLLLLLGSVMAMRSLRRSSTGGRSFWGWCDDPCDERKDDRELAVACRANDGSRALEGEGRSDGERDRLLALRPLDMIRLEMRSSRAERISILTCCCKSPGVPGLTSSHHSWPCPGFRTRTHP